MRFYNWRNVWYAINDKLGLALESDAFGELLKKVNVAAKELMELNER